MVPEQRWSSDQTPSKLIFIVEDDPIMVEFLVAVLLDETPYLATAVHNGFEALETLKEIKPHLFILGLFAAGDERPGTLRSTARQRRNGKRAYDHAQYKHAYQRDTEASHHWYP